MKLILMILCLETYAAVRLRPASPLLYKAIRRSNVSDVRKLASRDTVNERFDNLSSLDSYPLSLAIIKCNEKRKYDIVKALLAAGAEVNPPLRGEEKPPLFLACLRGKMVVPIVKLLLDNGADSTILVNGEDVFTYCVRKKAWSVAKYLLDRPDVTVNVNRVSAFGENDEEMPLFTRCCMSGNNFIFRGNYDLVKAILEKKNPDLGWTDTKGRTPIFHVSWDNTGNLARIMIAKGADVHHQDLSRATPIYRAVADANANMVRVLLENGANPNAFSISLEPEDNVEKKQYTICLAFNNLRTYVGSFLSVPEVTDKIMKCVRILLQARADLTVEDTTNGRRIIDNIIDAISPLKNRDILPYTPILLDLLEIGALKLEQLRDFKLFSIISPPEFSFDDYFRQLFRMVRPNPRFYLAADFKGIIKNYEEYYVSHFCAVLMKYYERCNKIRLPRVFEFIVEDKMFEIYYGERKRIFAKSYFSAIPLDLFKSIWMDAINPEVSEKCKLRGLSLRVVNLTSADVLAENVYLSVSAEALRPITNDLIDDLEPKLNEDVEVGEDFDDYNELFPKFDDEYDA